MSKVTHLSDVNALLRHAGVSGLQYQDFSKPLVAAAEPAVEAPVAPPVVEQPLPAVAVRPQPPAPVIQVPVSAPVAAPINSTFDRLRRKAAARRAQQVLLTMALPGRQPLLITDRKLPLADKTWAEIWTALARPMSARRD